MKPTVILSRILAFSFLLLAASSPAHAQCGDFYDGFESGSLGPVWQFGTGSYSRTVSTTTPAVGSYAFTHASTGSNSFYEGTYATWTPSQPTYISFWMRTNTTTAANGYVVIGNSGINTDNGILFCYFNASSGLRFFNSTGYNHPIVANQWYHVEARDIDWVNRHMDIYIDNVLILTNWAFRSTSAQNMDRIHLFSLSASSPMYDDIQIGVPGVVIDSFSVASPTCYGDTNATIDMTAHSPNGNMTYAWSTGATTEDLTNLAAGVYTISVTDSLGCVVVDSVTVTQPGVISTTSVVSGPTCPSGSDGTVDLSPAGGTPGYVFNWSNGATTEDLTSVAAGTYTLTISDQNNCSATDTLVVAGPAAFDPQATITSPTCFGATDGSIDLNTIGGAPTYTFTWSNGDSTEDISGLAAGLYFLSISDMNGCNFTDTLEVLPSAPIAPNALVSDLACNGDQSGAIDLAPSGGTPVYVFNWNTGAVTEDLSSLVAGSYVVTITDVNNCIVVDTIEVNEPASILVSATVTNATTLPSNGAVDVSISGGSGPFTYLWSNGATTEDISNLTPGNYGLTVTDANGCTSQASYFVDLVQSVETGTLPLLVAYPNPFNESVQVSLEGSVMEPVQVSVLDIHGRVIWEHNSTQTLELIPTHAWPAGTYVLRAKSAGGENALLIVKQ